MIPVLTKVLCGSSRRRKPQCEDGGRRGPRRALGDVWDEEAFSVSKEVPRGSVRSGEEIVELRPRQRKPEEDQGLGSSDEGSDLSESRGTESRSMEIRQLGTVEDFQHLEVKPKFQVMTVPKQ